ncbi:MAG: divergent PAP2 family protein [Candidatus Caenarcaniphilales bacterium]|jgi:acid phosphatase family membrane protein YuiD|nr:divergent PAP2 family protein [Candidatus Caenarcaniphilales bacterium]
MFCLAKINANGFEVLTSLVVANVAAQVLKTIIFALQNGKLDPRMLVTTGGMPSSHSASVVAMATSVGLIEGFDSVVFALAAAFAIVVMYDSAGIRRSAGRQAAVLNRIINDVLSPEHKVREGRLKELLGHSPFEVIVGALLGIFIAILLRYFIVVTIYG